MGKKKSTRFGTIYIADDMGDAEEQKRKGRAAIDTAAQDEAMLGRLLNVIDRHGLKILIPKVTAAVRQARAKSTSGEGDEVVYAKAVDKLLEDVGGRDKKRALFFPAAKVTDETREQFRQALREMRAFSRDGNVARLSEETENRRIAILRAVAAAQTGPSITAFSQFYLEGKPSAEIVKVLFDGDRDAAKEAIKDVRRRLFRAIKKGDSEEDGDRRFNMLPNFEEWEDQD